MGALAIIDKYPQYIAEIVSKARKYFYSIKACYPDGDWYEGPTYGMATVKSIALSIDTLKRRLAKPMVLQHCKALIIYRIILSQLTACIHSQLR